MPIDIGAAAINRADSISIVTYTFVGVENPANADGTLESVEIYLANGGAVEAATFIHEGSNVFSTRDTVSLGTLPAGYSIVDISATPLDVVAGDYLGVKGTVVAAIDRDLSGSGAWYYVGDAIPCASVTFTFNSSRTISLYGTGTESGGGSLIPIVMHHLNKNVRAG